MPPLDWVVWGLIAVDTRIVYSTDLTYRMRSVLGPPKVHHAINTGKGSAMTLAAMGVELLLGENVTASLAGLADCICAKPWQRFFYSP